MDTTTQLAPHYPMHEWIIQGSITLIIAVINGLILYKEISKRRSTQILFISKYLKIYPLICMASGISLGIFGTTLYIPGLCYVSWQLFLISVTVQAVSLGFFQLSRLYFCFSRATTKTSQGYPNWVFYSMFGIGSLAISIVCIASWFMIKTKYCGWNDNMDYVTKTEIYHPNAIYLVLFTLLTFFIWDWITFILYIAKYCLFKSRNKTKNVQVHTRIRCILMNIIIGTGVYEFCVIVCIISIIITQFAFENYFNAFTKIIMVQITGAFYLCCINYGMLIMQQHNHDEYTRFLRVITCICCGKCLNEELRSSMEHYQGDRTAIPQNTPTTNPMKSNFETEDIGSSPELIKRPTEFSLETLTAAYDPV